jgi:RNA polymerase sigma-70 factor (ECF subfamily)
MSTCARCDVGNPIRSRIGNEDWDVTRTPDPSTAAAGDHGLEFLAASDRTLIDAAALGERDAFEAIVQRYGPQMLRYAQNMLSDAGAAEEVTQDAFVAAWKGLDNFRGEASLRTWLFTLVSHKVVDHRRRRSIAPAEDWLFDTTAAPVAYEPEIQVSNTDFLAALASALAELPYRQRAAWLLREVDGMTHAEIGRILTITPSAVRGHLTRAKGTLSGRMAAWR